MKALTCLHPSVPFCYLLTLSLIPTLIPDPALLILSLIFGAILPASLCPRPLGLPSLILPPLLLALLAPLFNRNGSTPILYLASRPLTLEALTYGVFSALTLLSVLMLFRTFSVLMTADRLQCLLSHLSPPAALLLSLSLRLSELLRTQYRRICLAQRSLGRMDEQSLPRTLRSHVRCFSMLVTWAMEKGVIMADSMDARGYGLRRPSVYHPYRFTARDGGMLAMIVLLSLPPILAALCHEIGLTFYPTIVIPPITPLSTLARLSYGALGLLPLLFDRKEESSWT